MEMKLLFFLLSAILFQSSISIYAMEQIKRGWVALKEILNPFIMKAKFLPLLLLAILLQVSMFSFANEMTSARRIRLKNKTEVQHRSIPVTPDACIENSLLSIDLLSTVPTVTVIIKNAETDEVVYTSTDLNVDKVYIDLTGEEKGKYTLEIQLPKEAFTGDFELE